MQIRKQALDTIAVLLVILASGNPVFAYLIGKEALLVGLPLVLFIYSLTRNLRIQFNDMLVLASFALIGVIHLFIFGVEILPATLGFLLKLATGWLIVRIVKNFVDTYVRLMYILAYISIIFFIPQIIFGDTLRSYVQFAAVAYSPETLHIGIHNFNPINHAYRNSGIFWEPGAFAGYLMLALILAVGVQIKNKKKINFDKTNIVLFIALFTTQSTTGYVVLMLFGVVFLYLSYGVRYVLRFVFAGMLLVVSILAAYQTLPFLAEKIDKQFEIAVDRSERSELTRFGNALYDWEFIKQRPIFGWSPYTETRGVIDPEVVDILTGQGNGFTALIVRFGLVGFLIYGIALQRSFFKKFDHLGYSLFSVLAIFMLLIGEQFLNFPLFMTLVFLASKNNERQKSDRKALVLSATNLR